MRRRKLWVANLVFALVVAGCSESKSPEEHSDASILDIDASHRTNGDTGSAAPDGAMNADADVTSLEQSGELGSEVLDAASTTTRDAWIGKEGAPATDAATGSTNADGADVYTPSTESGGADQTTVSDSGAPLERSSESSGLEVNSTAPSTQELTSAQPSCDGGVCPVEDGGSDSALVGVSCPPSCIADLFTSCVPSGNDECTNYGYGEVLCWPNGAYQEMAASAAFASGTVYHANGDVCLSTLADRQPDNSSEVQWLDGDGVVVATGSQEPDGDITIQCAGEETEHFVPAGTDCAPFYLPFLDGYACNAFEDGEPPAGTCGN